MTLSEAKQYLESIGVAFPDFVIEAIIEQIKERDECLRINYNLSAITLIYCCLIAIIAGAQSGRYVSNRGLSGGLYQGFTYKDSADLYKSQLSLLKSLDKKGCVSGLIPKNPFSKGSGFILSVRGNCNE